MPLEGLDDIGLTLQHDSLIRQFELRRPAWTERRPAQTAAAERET